MMSSMVRVAGDAGAAAARDAEDAPPSGPADGAATYGTSAGHASGGVGGPMSACGTTAGTFARACSTGGVPDDRITMTITTATSPMAASDSVAAGIRRAEGGRWPRPPVPARHGDVPHRGTVAFGSGRAAPARREPARHVPPARRAQPCEGGDVGHRSHIGAEGPRL